MTMDRIDLWVHHSDDGLDGVFERSLRSPSTWFHQARRLFAVMSLLHQPIEAAWESLSGAETGDRVNPALFVQGTYLMLAGFCVENLLKGILIATDKVSYDVDGRLPPGLKSHDLVSLLGRTDIGLSENDRDTLGRITVFSTWAGRYPIPLMADQVASAVDGDKMMHTKAATTYEDDVVRCQRVIRKLSDHLRRVADLPVQPW